MPDDYESEQASDKTSGPMRYATSEIVSSTVTARGPKPELTLELADITVADNSTDGMSCESLLDEYRKAQDDRKFVMSFTDKALLVILERICG